MKITYFPYYRMLGYTDCLRSCVGNLLQIPPRKIKSYAKDYEKSETREDFITFVNKRYKDLGFQIYQVKSLKDFSIGCVYYGMEDGYELYHAIICYNNEPFFDPATGEKPPYDKKRILIMFNVRRVNL